METEELSFLRGKPEDISENLREKLKLQLLLRRSRMGELEEEDDDIIVENKQKIKPKIPPKNRRKSKKSIQKEIVNENENLNIKSNDEIISEKVPPENKNSERKEDNENEGKKEEINKEEESKKNSEEKINKSKKIVTTEQNWEIENTSTRIQKDDEDIWEIKEEDEFIADDDTIDDIVDSFEVIEKEEVPHPNFCDENKPVEKEKGIFSTVIGFFDKFIEKEKPKVFVSKPSGFKHVHHVGNIIVSREWKTFIEKILGKGILDGDVEIEWLLGVLKQFENSNLKIT